MQQPKPSKQALTRAEARPFLETKYELDRAHELELNKFTHVLEVERLKLLLLLNGGAVGLWLGFLKATAKQSSITLGWAQGLPVLLWLIGTLLAALAFHKGLATQRAFTQAYHNQRRAYEWHILGQAMERAELQKLLSARDIGKHPTEEAFYGATSDTMREEGEAASKATRRSANASIAAFIMGALVALAGLGQ